MEISIFKRYQQHHVHYIIINNSQDMETTQVTMEREIEIYIKIHIMKHHSTLEKKEILYDNMC